MLARMRRYVEHETPTGDAPRATALARVLAAELEGAGASVELVPHDGFGHHVRADVPGAEPDAAPTILLGHLDTVHPVGTLAERPFRIVDDRAEGPGTFDMKAGLAVIVEALTQLAEQGRRPARPVRVLVTCDEEVGSDASRDWLGHEAEGAASALVLEPSLPGGKAKTARKGVATYRLVVTGRAAHAGVDPDAGVSAILELAAQILGVEAVPDRQAGSTLSVGLVRGGTAVNVVPARAEADIDVRFATPEEGERVDAALHALRSTRPGAFLAVERTGWRPPLVRTDAVVSLYRRARDVAARIGLDLGEGSTGGGSDGSFLASMGIPTLDGLGPRGGGAHAVDEHVVAADLPLRVALLRGLLEEP